MRGVRSSNNLKCSSPHFDDRSNDALKIHLPLLNSGLTARLEEFQGHAVGTSHKKPDQIIYFVTQHSCSYSK